MSITQSLGKRAFSDNLLARSDLAIPYSQFEDRYPGQPEPLRERRGDIPLLVGYFIDQFNKKLGKKIEGLSSEAMPILMEYSWPGNVRELENIIERAVLLADDKWIAPAELSQKTFQTTGPVEALSIKKASKHLERRLIEKALKLTEWNRTQASKILETSRPMLISKIKKYNLV